ncbi:MAG: PilW family protein [Herminiimonas sp.]|nr:PilW family protein [Herminiimonas sp.]
MTTTLRAFFAPRSCAARQAGVTLIELMIAITLGLLIVAGISALFINNSRARSEIEKTSQQIENGRYATQQMLEDIRLAGYYGELNPDASAVATPVTLPDPCDVTVAGLTAAIALPIQGVDNAGSIPTCISDVKVGSDILVLRRASTCVAGAAGCDAVDYTKSYYFQTSLCTLTSGQFVVDKDSTKFTALTKNNCTTVADLRSFYTRIYFVANNNKAGDGVPTLKIAELGATAFTIYPLVTGIEQMQVEYGIATATSEVPAVYTPDPGAYGGCAGVACQTNWRNVTAVKVNILARNSQTSVGFSDTRTYQLGHKADGSSNTFGPFGDGYKRHVYTTAVRLNNVAGRVE